MIKYPLNVTIDSNIFDSNQYDFEAGSTMNLLTNYVKKGKIKIFLSNIVLGEILKHIKSQAYDISAIINNVRKELREEYSDCLLKSVGVEEFLKKTQRKDLAAKAEESLNTFLKELDIQVLNNNDSDIDVDKIFEDYFNYNPPFEHSEKKRKEFPDAFIAAQIHNHFKNKEQLAIISKDKGFKEACNKDNDFLLFNSLGEFYDTLNREEENYDEAVAAINTAAVSISNDIKAKLLDTDCVIVSGLSVDKDGIESGYDYDETYVHLVSDVSVRVRTIDDMDEDHILATLLCTANIYADCFYDDYDNAVWDSEEKKYVFLETKQIREIHNVRFGVRIDYCISDKNYRLSDFIVLLNGDTRKERYEIKRKTEQEQYLDDINRASVGLAPLGEYPELLEESLASSKMKEDIVSFFDDYNNVLSEFEGINAEYYELIERIKSSPEEAKQIVVSFLEKATEPESLPFYKNDASDVTEEDINHFCNWIEEMYSEVEGYSNISPLPDCIYFGDTVSFIDADKNQCTLSLDEIDISPSEGQSEYIDITLIKGPTSEAINGYVQLNVGYITFDEDGGISNGCTDDITFFYDEILESLKDVIISLKRLLEKHIKIKEMLKEIV